MSNLESILKSRDITLLSKIHVVKAMVFPVVMYGCKSWTRKEAEHWGIDAFEFWYWRRFERPLECKEIKPINPKGNQPWIFIGRTDTVTEAPILWSPDERANSLEKTLMLGKIEEKGAADMRWLDGITNSIDMSLGKLGGSEGQGSLACGLQSMGLQTVTLSD